MKNIIFVCLLLLSAGSIRAQGVVVFQVRNADDQRPLAGATILILPIDRRMLTDTTGQAIFTNLQSGNYRVKVSYVGMEDLWQNLQLPLASDSPLVLDMEAHSDHEHEEKEVLVKATRISRSIANIPTRVEVISGEELSEKGNMKPGDIRMLLNESTGIQAQQTSATSFNAGIRIQGLDGRYTQILRDGYPLYSGFSGGLSIMQIPPLDLQQVEVIKGAASTLYGGGAIAGLVNLVSKTPGPERDLDFMINGTSGGGLDLSGFYAQRFGRIGLSFFGSRNNNKAFDPADIGLTAIPKFERYNFSPRIFFYGKKTNADIGVSMISENRLGGSVDYIREGQGAGFFEENRTRRISTQAGITHALSEHVNLTFKNSYSRFKRRISIPNAGFDALQQSSFSELSLTRTGKKADWIIGSNLITDHLNENNVTSGPERDYQLNTWGIFVQNVWTMTPAISVESGLRADYVTDYGMEILPRVSLLYKINQQLSSRIGAGYGYKTPTIFTEEAERRQFQNILPIVAESMANERSVGLNWDINYSTRIAGIGLHINHLIYYTRLNNPLVLTPTGSGEFEFRNDQGNLSTKGMETNLRLVMGDFKLFVGYTYTDAATVSDQDRSWLPLTARHRLNNVLMYEKEEKLKLGLEAYYFSPQKLGDGSTGKSYWITGFMAEKLWEHFSVFINFENFTDTRQTRFDTIFSGTVENPQFRDIYAPVDGFVVNGGIKLSL
jgi:iron complex outermembrane receptor protein